MQVLIIPSWYFPADSPSIAGRMFHAHAAALLDHGMDASIWYPDFTITGPLFKKATAATEDGVHTYRVQRMWPPKKNAMLLRVWISRACKDLQKHIVEYGKPEIVHAQSYHAAMIAAALHDKTGIPFIYTERLSAFFTRDIPTFQLDFFKPVFEKASVITCVSPGLAEILQNHSRNQIRVVPNFVDTSIFFPDQQIRKREYFTWIAVGEPAKTKGLDLLLQAFATLKANLNDRQIRLILVDDIPEQKELSALAEELGIAADIAWKGLIKQSELATLYNESHAYVSASRVETFGKATIEAQACGLPVVATKTAGSTFIMKQPVQGMLAEVNDSQSLMKAMGKVMVDFNQYNSETIHEHVKKRFDKAVVMRQWIDLYKNTMA